MFSVDSWLTSVCWGCRAGREGSFTWEPLPRTNLEEYAGRSWADITSGWKGKGKKEVSTAEQEEEEEDSEEDTQGIEEVERYP